MAGAGYKLFNTGDVLTAAQVNTYLMEQTVMVFANAAARTTALSGVVSEGMISYLKDTNAVEVYDGSNWVSSDDPNAIQNTIVDAKGDLIAASAADTPARLAVGNNGETLVADSSTSTGLRWQATLPAGKNFLINGGFDIWQRGTSFAGAAAGTYTADRWIVQNSGTSPTISRQTTGAPNGAQYVLRVASTASGSYANIAQLIETANVELLWGSTATFSVKVRKNASYTRDIELYLQKSATVDAGNGASWSTIASKTISNASLPTGTGVTDWFSDYISGAIPNDGTANSIRVIVAQANTATGSGQYWEVGNCQLEIGSVPTQFSRAGGTLAGELQAAQRYYQVFCDTSSYGEITGQFYSTTAARFTRPLLVSLRTTNPTITFPSGTFTNFIEEVGVANRTPTAFSANGSSKTHITFSATGMTGATTNTMAAFTTSATAITISSEL